MRAGSAADGPNKCPIIARHIAPRHAGRRARAAELLKACSKVVARPNFQAFRMHEQTDLAQLLPIWATLGPIDLGNTWADFGRVWPKLQNVSAEVGRSRSKFSLKWQELANSCPCIRNALKLGLAVIVEHVFRNSATGARRPLRRGQFGRYFSGA